jgi:carbon monoxide dehydrogenase subunit G
MKISGTSTLQADPATVWRALNDPAVLVRAIPGCRALEALGEDSYAMTVAAGVGSIKGVYDGRVRLSDQAEPDSFRLHAEGSGAPGTISADVLVSITEAADGGTELTYDADAAVGGMIGGVGQRMLVGVSKRMAAEFFGNVDTVLSAGPEQAPVTSALTRDAPSAPTAGAVFEAPSSGRAGPGFVAGVAVGAAAALAGALVGGWLSRRGRG